ncbi:hypothetical protein LTR85_011406 [Meristemomyces frigidus]|nr:hypothetical protein LTR85_011406 [Meristemomyces frigidus]
MLYAKSFICALGLGALADAQITLGSAGAYGVFAASTITNTGLTTVGAKIGVSPGTAITGFPPGIATGQDTSNAAAAAAHADIVTAYNALAALAVTTDLTGQDLGGQVLDAGVYGFSSSGGLTGILTLDGQGNPDAVFVFKFGSTLTTATASSVVLINGAQACNVYWQVGSSATLGTATVFAGNVIAQASITVTTGVSLLLGGGFYAVTAAVTLDTNVIDPLGSCGGTSVVTTTPVTTPNPTTILTTITVPTTIVTPTTVLSTVLTTVTDTSTSTVTDPASTTTITLTAVSTTTVTQTVATTATSTTTIYSTKSTTKTLSATACPTAKAAAIKRANKVKTSTKYKTVTTTCAGHTSTVKQTRSVKATHTSTSTIWHTKSATTTKTATKTPSCTAKAKRDYQKMFG